MPDSRAQVKGVFLKCVTPFSDFKIQKYPQSSAKTKQSNHNTALDLFLKMKKRGRKKEKRIRKKEKEDEQRI
jgi:hypothetical protein